MTTALYRRYRPDTFADVIGQDHVTGPLRAALRANRVTHAYLFSGPRGCGKTTSARILARCLNCAQGPTDTPCGQCESCRELATGGPGSLDVVEIDAASHGGVDDARDLRERATFAPVRDRYKIFIVDEAHMVTTQGFNALLKLVEEPPEHVKFVFATTEPERVIGTIRSRTHHYPFRLVPPDVLEPYLAHLAHEEGVEVGPGVLPMVMRAGGGSVRDTLSVLDQLMAGSIDHAVSYETAVALLGYTDTALLDESVDALAGGDGAAAYRVVERMVDSGHDPRRFVEDLLQRLRDLLIIAVAGDGASDVLASTPVDQFERMRHQAANWGPRALSRAADLTDEALRQMTGATSPRLQLELLLGRILVPPTAPAARPVDEVAMPGTVGSAGGGAPREDAPQGRFGAREAREALERSRGRQSGDRPNERPAERADRSSADARADDGRGAAPAARSDGRSASSASHDPRAAAPGAGPVEWASAPARPAVPASERSGSASSWPEPVAPGGVAEDRPRVDRPFGPSAPSHSGDSAWPEVASAGRPSDAPRVAAPAPSSSEVRPEAGDPPAGSMAAEGAASQGAVEPDAAGTASSAPADSGAREAGGPGADAHSGAPVSDQAPAAAPERTRPSGQDADLVRGRWEEILNRLSSVSRVAWSLVTAGAQLGAVDGSELVLLFPTEVLVAKFWQGGRGVQVAEAVYEVTGVRVEVSARVGQSAGGAAVSTPSALASSEGSRGRAEDLRFDEGWVSEPPPFDDPASSFDEGPVGASHPDDDAAALDDGRIEAGRIDALRPTDPASSADAVSSAGAADPADARDSAEPGRDSADPSGSSSAPAAPEALEHASSAQSLAAERRAPVVESSPESPRPVATVRTGGPERRSLSVFTYDDPEPTNAPSPSAPSSATESDSAHEAERTAPARGASPLAESARPEPAWPETAPIGPSSPEPEARREDDRSAGSGPATSAAPAAPSDGWGPVAVPGSARQDAPAPWSAEPVFEDAPWTPGRDSAPDRRPAPTSSTAMSGWGEAIAVPGGVSFEDEADPAPTAGNDPTADAAGANAFDDVPSIDDEDIETSSRFGIPAVLDILGGTVIEELYDEGTR
ncbi:DNA polymerase III subunit gamma and tau [Actinomyces culturomici]|uniref:DNA polymerase III subunit gamma and tau n=1 Tax=Actinomyces culturomici TaxID=1926276 RepID=UPI001F489BB3|nr:DNA polymerase III subunit gamma and tau [Actinomyces culturomici]